MTSRCTTCSKSKRFRNHRGAKLSDQRCECGGKLEIIGGSRILAGKHPFDDKATFTAQWYDGEFYHADVNRKGEYYVWHEGYFHKIENPVLAVYKPSSEQKPERSVATEDHQGTEAG